MKDENQIMRALSKCGYPKRTIEKVKHQIKTKKETGSYKVKMKKYTPERTRGLVMLPYVQGVSESIDRVFRNIKLPQL